MAEVIHYNAVATTRIEGIQAVMAGFLALGWELVHDDIETNTRFAVKSVGEGGSPSWSPCYLRVYYSGTYTQLNIDLCTWIESGNVANASSRTNFDPGDDDDASNVAVGVYDGVTSIVMFGNKDFVCVTSRLISAGTQKRAVVARLDNRICGSGVTTLDVAPGDNVTIQLSAGSAMGLAPGRQYCIESVDGPSRRGYRTYLTVHSVNTSADQINARVLAILSAGSVIGGNPMPWVSVSLQGTAYARTYAVVHSNYSEAGSSGTIGGDQAITPTSMRDPSSLSSVDAFANYQALTYPLWFASPGACLGSSSDVQLPITGSDGDYFGVNEVFSGTATGGTVSTITVTGAGWTVDEFADSVAYIQSGNLEGAFCRIPSNTEDTLVLDNEFGSSVAAGDTFVIVEKLMRICSVDTTYSDVGGVTRLAMRVA